MLTQSLNDVEVVGEEWERREGKGAKRAYKIVTGWGVSPFSVVLTTSQRVVWL